MHPPGDNPWTTVQVGRDSGIVSLDKDVRFIDCDSAQTFYMKTMKCGQRKSI